MRRSAQDVLLLVFGGLLLKTGLTDLHLRFVKPSMQPFVVASAAVLLALAGAALLPPVRGVLARACPGVRAPGTRPAPRADEGPADGHDAPRTCWLLALPLLVLVVVSPPALGADAVLRSAGAPPLARDAEYPPLPAPRDGAVDLSLSGYTSRVVYEPETLRGRPLRLLGFAAPDGRGWLLARVVVSCCAADGRALRVRMAGEAARPVPGADTWWEVTGTYVPPAADDAGVPTLRVTALTAVPPPRTPYTSS